MTINKLSRSKRETSEAGFWLRIDDTHVAILALVWIQTRELLCTQSIRKYNWKIDPWYSRMDRLEFSSLRVVFLWGGTHIFLSRFYENRVERHHLSLSFVRLLTREEEWGKDTTATSLILACRAFDHNKERPNLSLESESFDMSCMLLSPGEDLQQLRVSMVGFQISISRNAWWNCFESMIGEQAATRCQTNQHPGRCVNIPLRRRVVVWRCCGRCCVGFCLIKAIASLKTW